MAVRVSCSLVREVKRRIQAEGKQLSSSDAKVLGKKIQGRRLLSLLLSSLFDSIAGLNQLQRNHGTDRPSLADSCSFFFASAPFPFRLPSDAILVCQRRCPFNADADPYSSTGINFRDSFLRGRLQAVPPSTAQIIRAG